MGVSLNLRQVSRRSLIESAAVILFVSIGAWLALQLTPYTPQSTKTVIYSEADETSSAKNSFVRATLVVLQKDTALFELLEGPNLGRQVTAKIHLQTAQSIRTGDVVVLTDDNDGFTMQGLWRLPGVALLLLLFLVVVWVVGRRQGLFGIGGLAVSLLVVALFILPNIAAGYDAFWVSVIGAYVIGLVSVGVAHGLNRHSLIAIIATLCSLTLVVFLAVIGAWMAKLTGVYDETTALMAYQHPAVDFRGVLVGGIIIATLGVLDDIVMTQVSIVKELARANPSYSRRKLYGRALAVGRDHIAAVVNTLALAYVGVSLPLILAYTSFSGYAQQSPLLLLNSEFVSQEVVRTLVSSIGLILAVPLSTLIAVVAYTKLYKKWYNSKRTLRN